VGTVTKPSRSVIFFGVDGVGKSTHTKILSNLYLKKGFKTKRCWLRSRHTLAYVVSQILLRLGYLAMFRHGHNDKVNIFDSRFLPEKKIWSLIEFISVIPWIITRMKLPLKLGYVVIADRYVVDTVIYNKFYIGEEYDRYSKILLRMIPRDALLIHLDADREELKKRGKKDWSKTFINYQITQYRTLAHQLYAISIKTSGKEKKDVARIIAESCKIDRI